MTREQPFTGVLKKKCYKLSIKNVAPHNSHNVDFYENVARL